jgi:putative acetyltransferase
MISYSLASSEEDYRIAKGLFAEYAASIKIDLDFQKFDEELLILKEMYGPPFGGIILAKEAEEILGCVAVRKITDTIGELKRMYVKPAHQNKGLGKILLNEAIHLAKSCNYSKVRLDTLEEMFAAINLYKQAGFYEIAPYYFNPIPTVIFFEKQL